MNGGAGSSVLPYSQTWDEDMSNVVVTSGAPLAYC